jgi:hypothetical protein
LRGAVLAFVLARFGVLALGSAKVGSGFV